MPLFRQPTINNFKDIQPKLCSDTGKLGVYFQIRLYCLYQ